MKSQAHKKLLVTGGAGFIGSNFIRIALSKGYSVVVLDAFTYAGHPENLEELKNHPQFSLIIGNICDPKVVAQALEQQQVDAVLNFAAESHVDRSISGPSQFIETNIL